MHICMLRAEYTESTYATYRRMHVDDDGTLYAVAWMNVNSSGLAALRNAPGNLLHNGRNRNPLYSLKRPVKRVIALTELT